MVRITLMPQRILRPTRRDFLAGLGAIAPSLAWPRHARAEVPSQPLLLKARAATIGLRPGQTETAVWALDSQPAALRFRRGSALDVTFENSLAVPVMLDWLGLDGNAAAEPLTTRPPVPPGAKDHFTIALRQAGTLLCDLRPLRSERPTRPLPLVVEEDAPLGVDRDEVFLVEDWRLGADGSPVAAGIEPGNAAALYTVNGKLVPDIGLRPNQRVRFRFINGSQRQVVALKVDGLDVRVLALDSAPAEPFLARNGALVLAPGGRVDALIDATAVPGASSTILLHDGKEARPIARLVGSGEAVRPAPLPPAPALATDGLPVQLDLKTALRIDLSLGAPKETSNGAWVEALQFAGSIAPAFRAKRGRIVVLALTNPADTATVFRLHGHHFRLLDRLDDGWKPFWLDTLAVEPGQTQRIAFAAATAGRWLIESMAANWAAARLFRWYVIE